MSRLLLIVVGMALVLPARALADGAVPLAPAFGATLSSEEPVEFGWDNQAVHPFGLVQVMYVATDPGFENVVYQHGDYCESMTPCPQGVTAPPFAPGSYFWRIHLFAWDWNPDSDVWQFSTAAPPPPPPAPPPLPPPPPPPPCRVPGVEHKPLERARRAIRAANCTVGSVRYGASRAVRRGRVIRQYPRAGTVLAHHANVRLLVSRGRR